VTNVERRLSEFWFVGVSRYVRLVLAVRRKRLCRGFRTYRLSTFQRNAAEPATGLLTSFSRDARPIQIDSQTSIPPCYTTGVKAYSIALVCFLCTVSATASDDHATDFARDVRPILERACWICHGPEKQLGGLRFDLKHGALAAGDSGEPAIVPGNANESELIRRIDATDAEIRMPAEAESLSDSEKLILRKWVDEGAEWPESDNPVTPLRSEMIVTEKDRQHWAYRPLQAVEPPGEIVSAWQRTPVDRFIIAALSAQGLCPNPIADRRVLIRRAYFDLLGLPPAPEEVAAFLADPAVDAYERLVDRLLESPHYGERWGRHWLDVARYADSDGMETDRDRPNAFHFRDFVIRALNSDMSYQTFVRWQLAGDEYEPDHPGALAATGFLTAAPNQVLTVPMEEERLRLRFNELDDMAATTVSAFLGLTLACARCHDHKFDAIPTRDYYRIQCAFTTTARDNVVLATRHEAASYRDRAARWSEARDAAKSRLDKWWKEQKRLLTPALFETKIDALPITVEEKQQLRATDSELGIKLAEKFEELLKLTDDDYQAAFNDQQRQEGRRLQAELEAIDREEPESPPRALAIVDTGAAPEPTWLLARGDFYAKQEPLSLGFLTVLTGNKSPEDYLGTTRREMPTDRSTGQRRALAEWVTDVDQGAGALAARVLVNRVWQHHFGDGLLRTASDFGVRGEPPTHPELMEWLAQELVSGGWRIKPLHRQIMTSAVYMQSSEFNAEQAAIDPTNRLNWRRRPQRLEAEIIRDAVLQVSGKLNLQQFGPAFKPPIPAEAMLARNTQDPYPTDAPDNAETSRRSVYMFHKRVVQYPWMQAFDAPDASVSCSRRNQTTVAPQALALMNDHFLRDRAANFSQRLWAESQSPDDWVTRGYWLAVSREPTKEERIACRQFLKDQQARRTAQLSAGAGEARQLALTDFCQALFGLNEFMYVD